MLYRKIRCWIGIFNWKGQIIYHRRWTGNDVKRKYFLLVFIYIYTYILHKNMPALSSNSNNVIKISGFFFRNFFFQILNIRSIQFIEYLVDLCTRIVNVLHTRTIRPYPKKSQVVVNVYLLCSTTLDRHLYGPRALFECEKKNTKKLTVITRNIIIEILLYRWSTHIIWIE